MKVWKYGDDINTDMLFPGKYTYTCSTAEEILPHLLEDLDSEFAKGVQEGDVLFVGNNFGCGSSREQPALGLKAVKVSAIVGKGFARIFYRASINQGLILLECADAVDAYKEGDEVKLDLENGEIFVAGKRFTFPKLPDQILQIREQGGLLKYAEVKLAENPVQTKGVAGVCGPKVQSDCEVILEMRAGISSISVRREVDKTYILSPEQIEGLVKDFLSHYAHVIGDQTVSVSIRDCGAPAFVLCARLETAFALASPSHKSHVYASPFLPPLLGFASHSVKKDYSSPRSRLYVPGHAPRFVVKAPKSGADMVSLDLEDAVAPDKKMHARILTRNALHYAGWDNCNTSIRINSGDAGREDIRCILPYSDVDVIICPKGAELMSHFRSENLRIVSLSASFWIEDSDAESMSDVHENDSDSWRHRPLKYSGVGRSFYSSMKFTDDGESERCDVVLNLPTKASKILLLRVAEIAAKKSVVRATKNISRCFANQENGDVVCEGINLTAAHKLAASGIVDGTHIMLNDIHTVLMTYGVEAARACIMKEVAGVFDMYGINVDPRHLSLIADYMTHEGGFKPFNRIGIASSDSTFTKITFETSSQFLTEASIFGHHDRGEAPSSRIVMGRVTKGGTGCFDVVAPLKIPVSGK